MTDSKVNSARGRWGDEDQRGAFNLVTEDVTCAAVGLVSEGVTLSLAMALGPSTPQSPHRSRPMRFMMRDAGDYALGARVPGFKFAEDVVQFPSHSGTHIDALAHVWTGDELYNGHPASATRTTRGAQRCGVEQLGPIATRCVMVDLVRSHGGPLGPQTPVERDDIASAILEDGVSISPGDAVLLRTGWWEQSMPLDDRFVLEPGITEQAAQWLASRDVAVIGADNYAVEVQTDEPGFPVHVVLLQQFGVPLMENLVLGELANRLAQLGRSTFLLVIAPLPLVGSTASPVNPVAVL